MQPTVLLTRRIPSAAFARLEAACDVDLHDGPAPIARRRTEAAALRKDGADLPPDRPDRRRRRGCRPPDLKIVANIAVGYDNIDVPAVKSRGVVVTNTPDVLTEATAELTWGLILAARAADHRRGSARFGAAGGRDGRSTSCSAWSCAASSSGIIGRGRIGRAVAAKAAAFGMTAVFAKHDMSLDELLVSSDVVSIHTPGTPETRHLIDRRTLARMKRSALLVNTARGSIVDEEALVWALKRAADCRRGPRRVRRRSRRSIPGLLPLENVVLAPHLGSATRETRTAMADLAVSNVLAVLDGRPPLTPV